MAATQLAPLVGDWSVEVRQPPGSPDPIPARHRFEWILDEQFVLLHWTVDHPDFPDALAVLSADEIRYYDTRGVARTLDLRIADGTWTMIRRDPDFWQRFTGTLGANGDRIDGLWEMSHDEGASWQADMTLTYTRLG